MIVRLDKFLANKGCGSRSAVKEIIRRGRVCVEGYEGTLMPDTKFDTDKCTVYLDEKALLDTAFTYIVLNKPDGVITATKDGAQKTVMDLLKGSGLENIKGLSPVGRLDKDTEGLLVITDDGKLNHELTSPKHHASKKYYVKVEGCLDDKMPEIFMQGLDIGDEKPTKPAMLEIVSAKADISEAYITITEGRYHQVKRMFKKVGCEVIYLKRISIGDFVLPSDLLSGQFRLMDETEVERLKALGASTQE